MNRVALSTAAIVIAALGIYFVFIKTPQPLEIVSDKPQVEISSPGSAKPQAVVQTQSKNIITTKSPAVDINEVLPIDELGPDNDTDVLAFTPAILNDISKLGNKNPATKNSPSGNDYDFPDVIDSGNSLSMVIPDAPIPAISSRRDIQKGSGAIIEAGDSVTVSYDMVSWSTGELVDSSSGFDQDLEIIAGAADQLPDYVSHSIVGRRYGATIQVVLKKQLEDLADELDPNDGYVLLVTLN